MFLGIVVVLTATQAGACRCADPLSRVDEVVRALGELPAPGERLSQDWYRVEIQNQPAGFVHNTVYRVPPGGGGGYLVRHQSRVAIVRQGERAVIEENTAVHENEDGHLLRLRKTKTQPGARERIEAGRSGSEFVTVVNDEIRREPLSPPIFAIVRLEWHLFRQGLRPGARLEVRVYDAENGGACRIPIEVREASATGASIEAGSCAAPGAVIALRLDGEGRIIESVQTLGRLRIRSVRAEGPLDVPHGANLDDLMAIRVEPLAGYPHNARRARLRLSNFPSELPAPPDGAGQRVLGRLAPGSFEIELSVPDPPPHLPYPLVEVPPEVVPHLAPAAQVQSDHPEIVAAAHEATRGASDALDAVLRLARTANRRLRSDMKTPNASALDAWRAESGDCSERALLLAALCRAAGIPARGVLGLVYSDRAFGFHMWNEVFLGGWIPLDAGLEGLPARPTHLRLAIDPLLPGMAERETREAAGVVASDLKIEFVSLEPLSPAESAPP